MKKQYHEAWPRQVRDKVVEKFKAWLGYDKISQALNISQSTVQSITWKWKEFGTTANLPRHGRPPKLTGWARRALIREAAKRPMITLEELQGSTAQEGESVHRTTISCALHKLGLYGRVAKRKPLLKHSHAVCHKPCGGHNTHVEEGALVRWDRFWLKSKTCGRKLTLHMNPNTTSPPWNIVVAASCYWDAFLQQGHGSWFELMGRWMEPIAGQSWKKTY